METLKERFPIYVSFLKAPPRRSKGNAWPMIRKKKTAPVAIEVYLDRPTLDKFRIYMVENCLDESSAMINVLERGMTNYWLQEFKQLKRSFLMLEKSFSEYKRDNELLKALEQQNEQMKKTLESENQQKLTTHQSKHR